MKAEQKIQEDQYHFPYHYIPEFTNNVFKQTFHFDWGYEYLSYLEFVIKILEKMEFNSLVDVGCGDGRFLFELKKIYNQKKLTGIDYSPKAIKFANVINPDIEWIQGNICDQNILKEKTDVITLIETLEHIPPEQINDFLLGLKYHLKPNGYLIITVPSDNLKVTKKHYQHFNKSSLETIIGNHFKIEKMHFINKLSFSWKLLNKLLTNRLFILNHKGLRTLLYKHYINSLLLAKPNNASRLVAICK